MRISILVRLIALISMVIIVAAIPPWKRPGIPKPPPRAFGVAVGYGLGGARELDQFKSAWYTDFGFRDAVIDVHQRLYLVEANADWRTAPEIARQHPGEWWQFGNEPNDPNQDNLPPEEYAMRYHAFYFGLKAADPTASIMAAGIANADARWANTFREAYRTRFGRYPRVDGWSIHNYLLDSCAGALDANVFKSRIVAFRDWMAQIGVTDKPLLLTEYGVLYGNGCCGCPIIVDEDVTKFMRETALWLKDSRLVQGWAWFAANSGGRYNGDLFGSDSTLTQVGATYRDLIQVSETK